MEILHHLFRNSNVSQQVNVYALWKRFLMQMFGNDANGTENE